MPTNATFGFTNMMFKLLKRHRPEYVAVALDAGRETFRNQMFAGLQKQSATRAASRIWFRNFLTFAEFSRPRMSHSLEIPGYEADDIIATLCDISAR